MSWLNNRGWKNTAAQRKEVIDDLRGKLETAVADRADALKKNADLTGLNEQLKSRTDMAPILEAMAVSQAQQSKYFDDGRARFGEAIVELHALRSEFQAQMKVLLAGFEQLVAGLERHLDEDTVTHKDDMQHKQSFVNILSGLEQRVSANQELVSTFLTQARESKARRQPR